MGFKHYKFQPNEYVLVMKNGKVIRQGIGLSFFCNTLNTGMSVVPTVSFDTFFAFNDVLTSDFQRINIQGDISYIIHDYEKVAGMIDFSYTSESGYEGKKVEAKQVMGKRITNLAKTSVSKFVNARDYVQINTEKTSLVKKKEMVANDAGELLGELLWYGKVLYTNGLIWKYYALSKESEEKINGIRKNWIIADKNEGATSPDGKDKNKNWKKERKTWIFKQCKEKPLKIISKNIGDLTKIYNKIKDNTSMPAFNEFNSQDYQEWKNLKTNLAAIDWTEVIF